MSKYEAVPGYFIQDFSVNAPVAVPPHFGLLDTWTWDSLKTEISQLNTNAQGDASYKLFFLGRHGQGFHNVGESKYGTEAWDDYWSLLNGDGEITWGPDADLTPLGISQAQAAHEMWLSESTSIYPTVKLVSPMSRAISTFLLTFNGLGLDANATILENCREEYGIHTCDKRRTKSEIAAKYPEDGLTFEEGFTEEDLLWEADVRESREHDRERARSVLDRVFGGEWGDDEYISITAHGGIINAFLEVIGRERYSLPTGGVLPVIIKRTPT